MSHNPLLNICRTVQKNTLILKKQLSMLDFDLEKKENNSGNSINSTLNNSEKIMGLIIKSRVALNEDSFLFRADELDSIYNSVLMIRDIISTSIDISSDLEKSINNYKIKSNINDNINLGKAVQRKSIYDIPTKIRTDGIILNEENTELPISSLNIEIEKIKPLVRSMLCVSRGGSSDTTLNDDSIIENKKITESIINEYNQSKNIVKKSNSILLEIEKITSEVSNKSKSLNEIMKNSSLSLIEAKNKRDEAKLILENLNENLKEIENDRAKTSVLFSEVRKDREIIQSEIKSTDRAIKKIEEATATASTASEKLKALHEKSDGILERANQILTTTGSVSLGKSFSEQYTTAKKNIWIWPTCGAISLITAIAICFYAIANHINNETSILIARLAIAPIALIGVWFSASQYVKQNQIIEDYAYKKTIALSLVSFKNELKEAETNHEREYILDVLKELHKSPLDSLDKKNITEELEAIERMRVDLLKSAIKNIDSKQKSKKDKKEKGKNQ